MQIDTLNMRPAFSSTKQAAAFALLLLVVLLSPVLAGKSLLPPREELYNVQGFGIAPLPWLRQQIFEETNDIDIAFIGSSRMLHGIDTPYVQAQLSGRLGRQAIVRSICWGGAGDDILYLISQDLLAHRHVRLLVFYDEDGGRFRNPLVPIMFRWCDNRTVLTDLPAAEQIPFYGAALLGIPRNLLTLLRPEIPGELLTAKPNLFETTFFSPSPASILGSVSARRGFNPDFGVASPFIAFEPLTNTAFPVATVYSESTKEKWKFENVKLPPWQANFAQKFTALAHQHGSSLVLLHLPDIDEIHSPVIPERKFWPDLMGTNLAMVGIPGATLFADLTSAEVYELYFDPKHLNKNGRKFFTSIITPVLLQLYENSATP